MIFTIKIEAGKILSSMKVVLRNAYAQNPEPIQCHTHIYSIGGRPVRTLIRSAMRKASSSACWPFNRGSQCVW